MIFIYGVIILFILLIIYNGNTISKFVVKLSRPISANNKMIIKPGMYLDVGERVVDGNISLVQKEESL
jgi:hypothetical protein